MRPANFTLPLFAIADHLQRPQKKHPPPNAIKEPLSKRPYLKTPEINDTAIKPQPQRQTQVPQTLKPSHLIRKNLHLHDKMTKTTKSGAASKLGKSKSTSSSTSKMTKLDKTKSTTTSSF